MVTSIARQSVLIKCNMQASVLLGNYEYYYAAGLLLKLRGTAVTDEGVQPKELYKQIVPELDRVQSEDIKESYLVQMLKNYKPLEEYDEQMKALLQWGLQEDQMWQVQI